MTINEIIEAKNEATENRFGTNFAGYYDISDEEAERIAEKVSSLAEFEDVWQNSDWWADDNQ